ncbi:ABC transporter ATP-binding protein [Rhodovulum sp. 12E13]|uniref:ABC transporter ATP-binding protein n=1 Tax=Rhodovulum sp. 12E13 TaxID=2203891 RepID=UPI000E11CBD6|nr:ABC transporter ATP-binding protein [Rhodovulum sp. 12E13]RDC75401.1 ABC transporter ATP-binding protein [Rhodovulum sp. 12E13]
MTAALLEVDGLSVAFGPQGARLPAVEGVSFSVAPGEIVALVGESGSGKSATAMALARLNEGPGTALSGRVTLSGRDVLGMDGAALRDLRGRGIAMVFQDAAASLNPCETVGDQIAESIVVHGRGGWRAARARAVELLAEVGLPEPARRAGLYPHELSGGQRQRAMIALALACDPALLIADEPTTALDVTIQAQILALLKRLVAARDMGLLLITHDLGVVAGMADRVLVIYAGRIVEGAPVEALFAAPRHPYTRDLIDAAAAEPDAAGRLAAIPGAPPRLDARPAGCAYAPRCRRATERCRAEHPPLAALGGGLAACFHPVPGPGEAKR